MTKEEQHWIDNAGYKELLERSRHVAPGDKLLNDADTREYFQIALWRKRQALTQEDAMAISKAVGW
ncbi:MAG: hypothetical protein V4628_05220 [Pseudomonadota bacterium]